MRLFLAAVLLGGFFLGGCERVPPSEFDVMTPEMARSFGVAVHDNDVPTGRVVRSECATFAKIEKECGLRTNVGMIAHGCATAANLPPGNWPDPKGEYNIFYADCGLFGELPCNAWHEAAHAIYEQKGHTHSFIMRQIQGDQFAACPG